MPGGEGQELEVASSDVEACAQIAYGTHISPRCSAFQYMRPCIELFHLMTSIYNFLVKPMCKCNETQNDIKENKRTIPLSIFLFDTVRNCCDGKANISKTPNKG